MEFRIQIDSSGHKRKSPSGEEQRVYTVIFNWPVDNRDKNIHAFDGGANQQLLAIRDLSWADACTEARRMIRQIPHVTVRRKMYRGTLEAELESITIATNATDAGTPITTEYQLRFIQS